MNENKRKFLKEFSALLKKYNADIDVTDDYNGYPECGQELGLDITIRRKDDTFHGFINMRGENFNHADIDKIIKEGNDD